MDFRLRFGQSECMPEKTLIEVGRVCREKYQKGKQALERNNFDYAASILFDVLKEEPGFYECRAALRAAQHHKADAGRTFFKKMFGAASHSPLNAKGQMALRNNPQEALQIAEQILNGDPLNTMAHRLLAEAADQCGYPKTAVLSLEILFKHSSGDAETARKLAEALAKSGQLGRAEQIFVELVKADPNNQELAQAYKNICAQKTLSEGGYEVISEGQGSYRDILKNEAESVVLEQENRHHKDANVSDRLLAEYLARLPAEPLNMKLRRSIAELYANKKDFENSIRAYQEMAEMGEAADPSFQGAITETRIKQFDHRIHQLEESSPPQPEALASLRAEKIAFVLEEAKRRVEKNPADLALRFELGQLFFEAGQITQAIQEFQKAQNNPQKRFQAMHKLALCFGSRGLFDIAARTLQNALKEKPAFDDEKKELIYSLGCILEKMGRTPDAMEQFKQIYERDIGYKEVAAKVDAFYTSQYPGS